MDIEHRQNHSNRNCYSDRIGCAAQLLQISEYSLFHAAYRFWFGSSLEDVQMEPLFDSYMFHGNTPFWASHFARAVIKRAGEPFFDPSEFGISPPSPLDEDLQALGTFYVALFGLGFFFFMVMLTYSVPSF